MVYLHHWLMFYHKLMWVYCTLPQLIKAVVCNYFLVVFAKIDIMILHQNKIQINCVQIHCLWVQFYL